MALRLLLLPLETLLPVVVVVLLLLLLPPPLLLLMVFWSSLELGDSLGVRLNLPASLLGRTEKPPPSPLISNVSRLVGRSPLAVRLTGRTKTKSTMHTERWGDLGWNPMNR